jgi:hypothetical protein
MSVAQLSSAGLNKLFLEYIKPGLEIALYENTSVYDRFKTNTEDVKGKYGITKVLTSTPKSFRASSSPTFPTAKQGYYQEFVYYMKRGAYGTLQFDGLAMACGKGAGAVKELVKAEVDALMLYIPSKLNKQFWGDGSGRLAITYAGASASTTVYVDGDTTYWGRFGIDSNEYTNPSQYLFENMSVDIYSSAGVLEASDVDISSITLGGSGTDTLTMGSAVTCSANSFLFDHDTYAATEAAGVGVPMGLYGICESAAPYVGITAATAFQGVTRSTNTWAQAQMFNMGSAIGTPAVITDKMILKVIQKVERYGAIDVIMTNDSIWRALFEILKADKTMPNDPGYWGGLTGMKFYAGKSKSIPIVYDEDCPDGRVYFWGKDAVQITAPDKAGLDWLPGDNGNILSRVQGADTYAANLRWYYQMTAKKPRNIGVLRYVKHASA